MINGSNSPETIKVVRVFLASPGDLQVERRLARDAVAEINRTVARPAGFHVDLIGWEDTLSAVGRPQGIINEDLETCQVFIGMLWARWGTPPDLDGRYTSGFEEEFTIAIKKHTAEGRPHITLFFKDVEPSKLADPGKELSKVLEFKKKIVDEKSVLYETFSESEAIAQKIRFVIADYIHKLDRHNVAHQVSGSDQSIKEDIDFAESQEVLDETEGAVERQNEGEFVKRVGEVISSEKIQDLSNVDIARIRNIAASYALSSNDQVALQAHDANILFSHRDQINLTPREMSSLADAGLDNWPFDNCPIWYWLRGRVRDVPLWLPYSTVFGPDERRIGAFSVMSLIGYEWRDHGDSLLHDLGNTWFGKDVSGRVKSAALDYIGDFGNESLIELAKLELAKNGYATRKSALEAVVKGIGRSSLKEAAAFAIQSSFDEIGENTAAVVLNGMAELDDELLIRALDHRSPILRAKAIELLAFRKILSVHDVEKYFNDGSASVRRAAVMASEELGKNLAKADLKAALVKERNSSDYDREGNDAFKQLWHARVSAMAIKDIREMISAGDDGDDLYFAMVAGHPAKMMKDLRYNVDNRFSDYWDRYITGIVGNVTGSSRDAIEKLLNEQRSFRIRSLMRNALDVISVKGGKDDLARIRKALDEEAVDPRFFDVDFLGRYGDKEDIVRIINIANDYRSSVGSFLTIERKPVAYLAAKAILRISKNDTKHIIEHVKNTSILAKIIHLVSSKSFKDLGKDVIAGLLLKESPEIRKATSLKILTAYSSREITNILRSYQDTSGYRYYNVIKWLDLGQSWPREKVLIVAKKEIQRV